MSPTTPYHHTYASALSLYLRYFSLSLYRLPKVHTALHICQLKLPIWRQDPRCTVCLYTFHQQTHTLPYVYTNSTYLLPIPTYLAIIIACTCMYTHSTCIICTCAHRDWWCIVWCTLYDVIWCCDFIFSFVFPSHVHVFKCMCVYDCLLLPWVYNIIHSMHAVSLSLSLSLSCLSVYVLCQIRCLLHKRRDCYILSLIQIFVLNVVMWTWYVYDYSIYDYRKPCSKVISISRDSDNTVQYSTASRAITQWTTHKLTRNIECWYNIIGRIPLIGYDCKLIITALLSIIILYRIL